MKKVAYIVSLFVFVGLIIAVSTDIFSGNSEEKVNEEVTEEEVTDVVFFNPKVRIQENWIEVSVEVNSSMGVEKLSKSFGILYNVGVGNQCYSKYTQLEFAGVITQQLLGTTQVKKGEFCYDVEEYEIAVLSRLPDVSISNRMYIYLPNNISVTKYGHTYKFERVDFTCSTPQFNISRVDNKLFKHDVITHINYDKYNYSYNFVQTNEIFHIN